jgi:N-acetylmuramoyl-L-alanine amidase
MAFQIAYCAGHYLGTPGKRVPKSLDPNQTREWTLNDRVADYFLRAALEYEGVAVMRTDDSTGKKHISIKNRTKSANNWGADLYLDIHHNAGINGGTGGGVVAFSKKKDATGKKYRDAIYAAVIAAGGLKGNRVNPLVEKNYSTMVYSKAPAVLVEYGFMDSRTDYPIISTDEYAKMVGYATMEGIAKVAGLKKKTDTNENKEGYCEVNVRVLKNGAKGEDVKAMQTLLIGYGYKMTNGGKTYGADGSFGGATEKAVKAYQKDHGLDQDGSCGPATWNKLLGVN